MADEEQQNTPPPPPQDPESYEQEGYTPEPPLEEDKSFVEQTGPAVSSTGNKNMVLIVVGLLLGGFLLYQIFSGDGSDEIVAPVDTGAPAEGESVASAGEIALPPAPVLTPLPPPPPPPPDENDDYQPLPSPPPVDERPDIEFLSDAPSDEEQRQRRASSIFIVSGDEDSETEKEDKEVTTTAERAVATKVGDLNNLVLEGKIIDAVLETALDTTLQGPLRAMVTRDIYAESGYGVLIPKGSRLIGTYNTDIVRGQGRVFVIWERVIRPDGIDVQLDSNSVDRLGRSGMPGFVDERYFEIFGGAILTSIISIGLAAGTEALFDTGQVTETTNTDGSTTTNATPTSAAALEATEQLGAITKNVVGGLLDTRPSITVDQGTPLKVFVNRDLEFPDDINGRVRVIQ